MTVIKYNKKKQRFHLIFGASWLILGIIGVIDDPKDYFRYGYLFIGALYLTTYIFQNYHQYLTITKDSITKHTFPNKKIVLSEIKSVRDFAGDYILESEISKLSIQKDLIEPDSLKDLELVLNRLDLN